MAEIAHKDAAALAECEDQISSGAVAVHDGFVRIRSEQLFRADGYATFTDYCREVWDISDSRARQIIGHAKTLANLRGVPLAGEKPAETVTNGNGLDVTEGNVVPERVTRELSGMEPEEQRETYEKAKEAAKADGRKRPTAKDVAKAKPKPDPPKQYADTFDTDDLEEQSREASIVRDGADRPVPENLRSAHALVGPIKGAATLLDQFKKKAGDLHNERGGEFIPLSLIEEAVKSLKGLLTQAAYHTDCPTCRGKVSQTCTRCDGWGFIPRSKRGQLSQDELDWLEVTK